MRRILLAVLLASGASCIDEVPVGPGTVNGTYVLRTVNGSQLPYTMTANGTTTEILDGAMTLYQGGTYAESGHSRRTVNGETTNVTHEEAGSYALYGTSVSFTSANGARTRIATVSGATMTIVEPGMSAVFRK
jgi:hypothetical protein